MVELNGRMSRREALVIAVSMATPQVTAELSILDARSTNG